ncbi:hypothetical protein K1719_028373 [Acacia pycnantha]|nr:hypothetical protein K1719_028373 [Acacia pycnantha]
MATGGSKPFLPPEIISNILIRLPAKSIVRFRCVCKEWKNISKSPSFIAEHYHHHLDCENPFLLLHEPSNRYRGCSSLHLLDHKMKTVEVLSMPSINAFRHNWRIIGSCSGLLCVEVDHEVFTSTQVPTEDGFYPLGFGVYKNKLAGLYGFVEEDGSDSVYVRVIEEVASESGKSLSFTQKHRIDQVPNGSRICFWGNEVVCLGKKYVTEVEGDPKCVLHMFNPITNEEKKFNCSTSHNWCEVFNYEKSLVSVWNTQQAE